MNSSFSVTGLVMALVAGAVGAAAWAAISIFANFEIGYLAWGIGALVGLAMARFGGAGMPMGVIAAVISVASIFGGKYVAVYQATHSYTSEEDFEAEKQMFAKESKEILAMGDEPTDEQLSAFMRANDYCSNPEMGVTPEELDWFRGEQLEFLRTYDGNATSYEEWSAAVQASIDLQVEEEGGTVGLIKEDLGPIDLIFLFLGISTAFGIVNRAEPEVEYEEESFTE